jgi:hypothetical protein
MIPIPVNYYGTTVQTPTSGSYTITYFTDLHINTGSMKVYLNNNIAINTDTEVNKQTGNFSASFGDVMRVELTGSGVLYPNIKVTTGPDIPPYFGTIVASLCNKPSGPLSGSVTYTIQYTPYPITDSVPPGFPSPRGYNITAYINNPC